MSGGDTLTYADVRRVYEALSGMAVEERYAGVFDEDRGAWLSRAGEGALIALLFSRPPLLLEPEPTPPIPRDEPFDDWLKRTLPLIAEQRRRKQ